MKLTPHTAADSYYALGGVQPYSMALLQNLVPAPDSSDQWVPRPAATLFPGSNNADFGFISALVIIGNRAYGMVKSVTSFPGKDKPFCYDLLGGSLLTITGITTANLPTSVASTGVWTPPHMELIGTKIIVTHPGFSGSGANFFGVIDTTNPGALTWTSANTATNLLPSVPVWVSQFFQRAYFYCNPTNAQPAVLASDVLVPTARSNATYILTFDDGIPLLCGGTLGLDTQLGGKLQSLIIFKQGANQMHQVTGDFSATADNGIPPVSINAFSSGTGTDAPNTVCKTPKGLAFVAPDGLRLVDFDAHVSDPIGFNGQGISVPFIASVIPSRMSASSNGTILRISTINGSVAGQPQQDWCLDLVRQIWYGPHTFPVSLSVAYANNFVVVPSGISGLWSSDMTPDPNSVYVENGANYNCVYQSGLMPDRDMLYELECSKAVFYQGFGAGTVNYSVAALNQDGNVLDFCTLQFVGSFTLWDQFVWGAGVWLGNSKNMSATEIPWNYPVVFDRMAIQITVQASAGVRLGGVLMQALELGYTVIT
jgi:hypothetical protein